MRYVETFLLYARGSRDSDAAKFLRDVSEVAGRVVPSPGPGIESFERTIPEINGGWLILASESRGTRLITEVVEPAAAVVAFGEIFGGREENTAKLVHDTWVTGGLDAVRVMDGCFGAAIVDRRNSTIYLVSDLLGNRSLRFLSKGGVLVASSHDIPIVCTGLCSTEINLESAASTLTFDWSLGGEPLLRDLSACHANEVVCWKDGLIQRTYRPLLNRDHVIDRGSHALLKEHLESMREHVIYNIRSFCDGAPLVRLDLTSGLDSRSVLTVCLLAIGAERLMASTAGEAESQDVSIAGKLSARYGFHHEHDLYQSGDYDNFERHCRLLAFAMNGDTDGKRAITPVPAFDETP
mgnify:CR=1 FL=1